MNKKIQDGINKYRKIQEMYQKCIFDEEFTRTFNGFYKVILRPKAFNQKYIELLKEGNSDFEHILDELYKVKDGAGMQRIELAFASKIAHTMNNNLPIYDKWVGVNLDLPYSYAGTVEQKRIRALNIYKKLSKKIEEKLADPQIIKELDAFEKAYQCLDVSKVKQLDFILWTKR